MRIAADDRKTTAILHVVYPPAVADVGNLTR